MRRGRCDKKCITELVKVYIATARMDLPAERQGVATDLLAQILRHLYVCISMSRDLEKWAEEGLGVTVDKEQLAKHVAIEAFLDERYSDDGKLSFGDYLQELAHFALGTEYDIQAEH